MQSVSNTPHNLSLHSDSLRETTRTAPTQPNTPEGVSVTLADRPAISRPLSDNLSSIRSNPATLEELKKSRRAMEPVQRSASQRAMVMGAFAELASLQENGASPLKVAAQKLYMQGLACQQNPDIQSTADACSFLNGHEPDVGKHIAPPLSDHNFGGTPIEQMTDRFTATESLYKEVLDSNSPSPAWKKECIELAYTVFKSEVRQAENDAKNTVKNKEADVARTEEQLKTNTERPDSTPELVAASQRMHDEAKASLAQAKRDLEHLTQNAVAGIFLHETIANNEAKASGPLTMASVLFGTALPQTVLTAGHFGGIRVLADTAVVNKNMSTRAVSNGVAMGGSFKFLTNTLSPAVVYTAEKLGGRGLKPVPPDSVYPSPARVVTSGGLVYRRTDEEFKTLNDANNEKKATFSAAQADNKFGTLKGDIQVYASFAMSNALIRGVPMAMGYGLTHPGFRTLSAVAGGAILFGWQAYGQLSQKVDNRRTHMPTDPSPSLAKAWSATKAGIKNAVDIRNPEVRTEYLSRMAGGTMGAAFAMNLAAANKMIDTSSDAGKAAFVAAMSTESTALLQPFLASLQSGAEAKAGIKVGEYKDEGSARITNALNNIMNPDRPTLTHGTQAGTWARTMENAYHVTRGLTQLPVQAVAVAGETIAGALAEQGNKLAQRVADTARTLFSTPPANVEAELTEIVIDGGVQTGQEQDNSTVASQSERFERPQSSIGAATARGPLHPPAAESDDESFLTSSRRSLTPLEPESFFSDESDLESGLSPLHERAPGPGSSER